MGETLSLVEFAIGSNVAGLSGGLGRATKKVYRQVDQLPKLEDLTVDANRR